MTVIMVWMMGVFTSCGSQNKWGFNAVVDAVSPDDIDTVSSDTLKRWLSGDSVLLLDTRSRQEFEVSHLPDAVWVGYEDFSFESLNGIKKDTLVVVTCAVGSRSGDIAQGLKLAGFNRVYNHFGGIFDWTNRGYEVLNLNDVSVRRIHPYNALWKHWMNNYDCAYEP